jgi:peptidyl-prolyl cis-trans isomerase D
MMKFLRSQSQLVLIIVLGFIGLGFLFYGSSGNMLTGSGGHISNDYGKIDGSDLSVADLYTAVRNTRYTLILQGRAQQLAQQGTRALVAQEAWRLLLLLREADRLHIVISDKELADFIRNQPLFQKDGAFSPDVYQNVMGQLQLISRLPADAGGDPLMTTKTTYENVMRDNMRAEAVRAALFDSVRGSTADLSSQYEKYYAPTTIDLIMFDPKAIENSVQVTPDEVEAEYKAHPMNPDYRTKEKRNIDYVIFPLTADQTRLPAKEKAAAIEALGEKALDFALAFQPEPTASGATSPIPDFNTEAKKRGLTPVTTGFFAVDSVPSGLPPSPSFNNAAFALSKDNSISKVVELDNGVAVLHLAEIQPSDILPLDQVKAGIITALREAKAVQNAQLAAGKASSDLKAAMAKGATFAAAAASLNLKVETVPTFVPKTVPTTDAKLQVAGYVATTLKPGEVSDAAPIQGTDSMVIVYLDSRAKADQAGLPDFAKNFGEYQNRQLRMAAYIDWANWESSRPGTRPPPNLDAYGGVE